MHEVTERFLRYAGIDTQSSESSGASPSTDKQHNLAKLLVSELKEIGVSDVTYDEEHCYVYAKIPANNKEWLPSGCRSVKLGFVAHMDTSPEVSGADVNPRIVENYDGADIVLNEEERVVLSPKDFPYLTDQKGNDLIVTDGTTLLGADDKAGIAEIMTFVHNTLMSKAPHGELRIAFTPDEEIGEGTKHFNIPLFDADFAYTLDGGTLGELEYENFNAAEVQLTFNGRSVHPGGAKGKMINATLLAYEFHSMLPVFENPMYTEQREGFFHLNAMRGTVEKAVVHYIIRDHDKALFEKKKALVRDITDFLNRKYGENRVELLMEDVYYNMIEHVKPHMHLIENAKKAMRDLGIEPFTNPIRGGTDGASLSRQGLPCPNLCTGGYNYHGRFEYASVQEMIKSEEIIEKIAALYAKTGINQEGVFVQE